MISFMHKDVNPNLIFKLFCKLATASIAAILLRVCNVNCSHICLNKVSSKLNNSRFCCKEVNIFKKKCHYRLNVCTLYSWKCHQMETFVPRLHEMQHLVKLENIRLNFTPPLYFLIKFTYIKILLTSGFFSEQLPCKLLWIP